LRTIDRCGYQFNMESDHIRTVDMSKAIVDSLEQLAADLTSKITLCDRGLLRQAEARAAIQQSTEKLRELLAADSVPHRILESRAGKTTWWSAIPRNALSAPSDCRNLRHQLETIRLIGQEFTPDLLITAESLTAGDMQLAIGRLERLIAELGAVTLSSISSRLGPDVDALEAEIDKTLADTFGRQSAAYKNFRPAAELRERTPTQRNDLAQRLDQRVRRSISLLAEAREHLAEVFANLDGGLEEEPPTPKTLARVEAIAASIPESGIGQYIIINQADHVTINTGGPDWKSFEKQMSEVLEQIRRSNEIGPEQKQQLSSELKAGVELMKSSAAERPWIDRFVTTPLKYLAEKFSASAVGTTAAEAIKWLFKLLGS
jgi:hypothetical protein